MPAEPPFMKVFNYLLDNTLKAAVSDPLAFLTNLDTITQMGVKLLPVLPNEYPYPIPRGIYDLLVRK